MRKAGFVVVIYCGGVVDAKRKQGNEMRALSGMGFNIERFVRCWMRTIVFPILTRASEESFRK